ncbi:uncharacterized protein [Atheta coriaria]|uniref:uncharacterized protein n=1 Tax=Dalotia coriaria TaxID=877792 RepID=UPI0031F47814
MVIMTSCCCWRSVRKGSYACGIYTLVYFTLNSATMSTLLHEDLLALRNPNTTTRHSSILEPNTTSLTSMVFTVMLLGISSVGILTSLFLLLGLHLNKRWMFIPWVGTVIPLIIVDLTHCLYVFFEHTLKFNPLNSILFTLDFFLLIINIYALLCVISQYQELKEGRGRPDGDINRIPSIHYSTQPTATSFLRRAATYNETHASPTQSPTGTGPHTSMGTEEPSPNNANRGHRKSVKFPDQDSPPHNNGRTLLEPWSIDIVKAPPYKHPDTTPLIEPPVVVTTTPPV